MRRINPSRFQVATRGTCREINSQIVLNLVRAHQPISRADLARTMGVSRGAVTLIVNDLLERQLIFEGATGETVRGRRPTFLYIDSRRRAVVAVDIRASETYLMLADLLGKPLTGVTSFPTVRDPKELVAALAARIKTLLAEHPEVDACEGIGVVVPGMVEHSTMRCCTRRRSAGATSICATACRRRPGCRCRSRTPAAPARWPRCGRCAADAAPPGDLVFVSVSDGVGVGVIINGEVLRGRHNIAGEFGHVPLSLDGPRCSCGSNGCWEAYVSNRATLARYFGRPARTKRGPADAANGSSPIEDLIARARGGDAKAVAALEATARYLGLGLASVINALDPARVYIGGEITLAWDLHRGHGPRRAGRARADAGGGGDGDSAGRRERVSAAAGRRRAGGGAGVCRAGRGVG